MVSLFPYPFNASRINSCRIIILSALGHPLCCLDDVDGGGGVSRINSRSHDNRSRGGAGSLLCRLALYGWLDVVGNENTDAGRLGVVPMMVDPSLSSSSSCSFSLFA